MVGPTGFSHLPLSFRSTRHDPENFHPNGYFCSGKRFGRCTFQNHADGEKDGTVFALFGGKRFGCRGDFLRRHGPIGRGGAAHRPQRRETRPPEDSNAQAALSGNAEEYQGVADAGEVQ